MDRSQAFPSLVHLGACLALLMVAAGCDRGSPGISPSPATHAGVRGVRLMDFDLPLHLVKERNSLADRPLVLFATGDGGWRGVDQVIVETIVRLGYPVAGFSAKDYLEHLDNLPEAATAEHVGTDYSTLIADARQEMGLPETASVILSGFSRGAALAVIAAGDVRLQRSLRGVVVMGLGDIEEHVYKERERMPTAVDLEVLKPYEYLKGVGSLRLSIIQSTHDRFLDASHARRLFGPDTDRRRLHPVEARSHTFDGALATLFSEIRQSLSWIESAGGTS